MLWLPSNATSNTYQLVGTLAAGQPADSHLRTVLGRRRKRHPVVAALLDGHADALVLGRLLSAMEMKEHTPINNWT